MVVFGRGAVEDVFVVRLLALVDWLFHIEPGLKGVVVVLLSKSEV